MVSNLDRLIVLVEEVATLKERADGQKGMGHIYTTISTLENRIKEIKQQQVELEKEIKKLNTLEKEFSLIDIN